MSDTPQQPNTTPPVDPNLITYFAETNFRNENRRFGIKTDDRRRHMYVIGKTGMGKSTMLENMIIQDIQNGNGIAVTDPHGDLVEKILDYIPSHRINDVVYFNPSDLENPIAFNILEQVDPQYRNLVSNGLVGVFKKIWADSWGPRLEYILINTILALLEYPGSTLLGVTRMLVDPSYRKRVVRRISDPVVKSFWVNEFNNYSEKFRNEAIAPIQNKVGQFLSSSLIRNIVGQPKSTISMRDIMDSRKIILMNLSKGRIGEENAALLGAMMITKIQLAAMSRVDTPEHLRQDFFLYVDEFQNFATESFAGILSEARKYRLGLIMAHQYVEQLNDEVRAAVFGNVGTMATFRVGAADAEELEKEFQPAFTQEDIVTLPAFHIYLRLMIDGVASEPFSANTLPPISEPFGNAETVIKVSRERYAKSREEVEDAIYIWSHADPQQAKKEIAEKKEKEEKKKKKEAEETEKESASVQAPPQKVAEDDSTQNQPVSPQENGGVQAPQPPLPPISAPQWSLQQPHAQPVRNQQAGGVQLFDVDVEQPWWKAAQADNSTFSEKHYTIADHEIPSPPPRSAVQQQPSVHGGNTPSMPQPVQPPVEHVAPVQQSQLESQSGMNGYMGEPLSVPPPVPQPQTVSAEMRQPIQPQDELHHLKEKKISFVDQLQELDGANVTVEQSTPENEHNVHAEEVRQQEVEPEDIFVTEDPSVAQDDDEAETLVPDMNYEKPQSTSTTSDQNEQPDASSVSILSQAHAVSALNTAIAGGGISLSLQQVTVPKKETSESKKKDTNRKTKKEDSTQEKKDTKNKKEKKSDSESEEQKDNSKATSEEKSEEKTKKRKRRRRKKKKSGGDNQGNTTQKSEKANDRSNDVQKNDKQKSSEQKNTLEKNQNKKEENNQQREKKSDTVNKQSNATQKSDSDSSKNSSQSDSKKASTTLQPGQSVHFD